MREQFVYILTNRAMPGLIKIGWTGKSIANRARALYTTGVPHPFDVKKEYRFKCGETAETIIHDALDHKRVNDKREFFRCPVWVARAYIFWLKVRGML